MGRGIRLFFFLVKKIRVKMYFPVRKHYVTPKKKKEKKKKERKKERKKALRDSRGLQVTFKSLELGSGQPA